MNAVIQGGCADLLAVAAVRCAEHLQAKGTGRILALIHDEILFEVVKEHVAYTTGYLQDIMGVEDLFGVKFGTDSVISEYWGEE